MISLRGITWDHVRGFEPMRATAREFNRHHPDVVITWERRSLRSFGDDPIAVLSAQYDLLVIDHPHCGHAAVEGCLLALDQCNRDVELSELAAGSVGRSHQSYLYGGHQWALAIDAAAHVSAWRSDLLHPPPASWVEVVDLAARGSVLWALKPVDAVMSFFTLAANLGSPCGAGEQLIDSSAGTRVLEIMAELAHLVPRSCLEMSPIDVLEAMAGDDQLAFSPLLFGYSNYSRSGFRPHRIQFGDIPALGARGSRGSVLGGAGLAVSSRCRWPDQALEYAFWIAGGKCQRGIYFEAGGQPAHQAAWEDDDVNRRCGDFFRNTREMMDRAYLRPRYDGYLEFQAEAGRILSGFLKGGASARQTLARMDDCYRHSHKQTV